MPAAAPSQLQIPGRGSGWHARKAELQRRLLVSLLTVTFYYYPSLLTATLSLFTCHSIDPITSNPGTVDPLHPPTIAYPQHLQASGHCQYMQWHLMIINACAQAAPYDSISCTGTAF